jgi:hypothetical protein
MSTLKVQGIKNEASSLAGDNLTIESNGSGVSLRAASDLRVTLGSEGTVGTNSSNWVRAAGQKLMLNAVSDLDVETSGTTRLRVQGSTGNLQFNSGYGSVATAYGCRAWVNFNGTGTVAIREDGNVSSITDNATGDYTVNYATSLVDANGAVIVTAGGAGGANGDESIESTFSQTASAVRLIIRLYTSTTQDTTFVNFAVFR